MTFVNKQTVEAVEVRSSLQSSRTPKFIRTYLPCTLCRVSSKMRETVVNVEPHQSQLSSNDNPNSQIIQEYEDLFHTIQGQLKRCQSDQDALRNKLESVLSENQSLSEQLQNEVSKNSSVENCAQMLNKNIKQQLDVALQERNSAVDMWQTSLQLIKALENELKDYRDNTHLASAVEKVNEVRSEYSRAINLLEEKLSAASSRLAKDKAAREVAEVKLEKMENDYKLLLERYEKRCKNVDEALIAKEIVVKKLEELEKNYSEAISDSKEAKLACSELEAALERSLVRLEEVLTREAEAKEKVDEALQIVDVALIERDNALKQCTQASEDAQQLRATIKELISEAGTEVQAEAEQIKEQYNSRIKTVLLDMRRLQAENKAKNSQIQKLRSDLTTMEAELQRSKRELDTALRDRPSLSALDRKLEGIFKTHELAGGESIRAELELEQLRAEIVKLSQSNELEQRQYLLERHVLEEQINLLSSEVEKASQITSEYAARNDMLNSALQQRDQEIIMLKKMYSSNISPEEITCKRCLCGLDTTAAKSVLSWDENQKMYHEIQSQLDSQRELANKWKTEANLITKRFQSRLRELHSETSTLRRENREIHNQLQAARYQLKNYQLVANGAPK